MHSCHVAPLHLYGRLEISSGLLSMSLRCMLWNSTRRAPVLVKCGDVHGASQQCIQREAVLLSASPTNPGEYKHSSSLLCSCLSVTPVHNRVANPLHQQDANGTSLTRIADTYLILQLFTLAIFIFSLALVGAFYPYNRGSLFTALIVLYALTAGISGYMACSYYRQMEGGSWIRNVLLTSFIYCGPLFLVFCFNNTVAIVYRVRASWLSCCSP